MVPVREPVPRARGPRLGIDWHMAEGGGTVGWVIQDGHPHPHFVVEYSGRVVQTLELDRMHTLIQTHPSSVIRTDDDEPYLWRGTPVTYGHTAAVSVLGPWAQTATTLGPNHATIGVECEGFASAGPNPAQQGAIAELFLELRARWPDIGSLGHRDHQKYKACPGRLFPWHAVGGHGGADTMGLAITLDPGSPTGRLVAPKGTRAIRVRDAAPYALAAAATRDAVLAHLAGAQSGPVYLIDAQDDELHVIRRAEPGLTFTPTPVGTVIPDPAAEARGYNAGLDAASSAVAAIPRR